MKELKYEYLLHQWGGFWNPLNVEIHGEPYIEYKWFDTNEARQKEINRLEEIRASLGTYDACIVTSLEEGYLTRYKVLIKSIVVYNNKLYEVTNDFGYGVYLSPKDLDKIANNYDYLKEWKWDINIYNQIPDFKEDYENLNRLVTTVVFE